MPLRASMPPSVGPPKKRGIPDDTTAEPPQPQSPGWYPDPEMVDTVRYWDGSR